MEKLTRRSLHAVEARPNMIVNIHLAPLRLPLRLCVKLSLAFAFVISVYSQTPRLVQLRSPDLTNLEEDVREQITTAQAALAAVTVNPVALSEAYGKLGQIYHAYSLTSAARDCYVNANLLAPKDFRWIYLLAKVDQQEGRFDDAIRRYQAA